MTITSGVSPQIFGASIPGDMLSAKTDRNEYRVPFVGLWAGGRVKVNIVLHKRFKPSLALLIGPFRNLAAAIQTAFKFL
ncbi:MAG: hypothetical protein JO108_13265 [Acidobacteriaceae bacterium]|nr:hypothetical protein [Acidobacteriaceae bacterium]